MTFVIDLESDWRSAWVGDCVLCEPMRDRLNLKGRSVHLFRFNFERGGMESDIVDIEETLFLERVAEFEQTDAEVREKIKQLVADAESIYKKIFALIEHDKREVLKKTRAKNFQRVEEVGELMDEFIWMNDETLEKVKDVEQLKL
ncbi:hypothetical protein GE061_013782 [Apolygus lucorum]|uniref:Uncharacterized protein n=1 Tax=Apolygus lucorum TaxID=248454 RepID=A0A8S9XST7_APOLU|nr:hypothetical protein GE061_013782 [Apolygus lucorum]